jgi:hypothetical protein
MDRLYSTMLLRCPNKYIIHNIYTLLLEASRPITRPTGYNRYEYIMLYSYPAAVIAHFLLLSPFTGLYALTGQIFSPTPGRHMTRAWDKSLIFDENENSGIWLSLGRNTCPWAEKVSTWNM